MPHFFLITITYFLADDPGAEFLDIFPVSPKYCVLPNRLEPSNKKLSHKSSIFDIINLGPVEEGTKMHRVYLYDDAKHEAIESTCEDLWSLSDRIVQDSLDILRQRKEAEEETERTRQIARSQECYERDMKEMQRAIMRIETMVDPSIKDPPTPPVHPPQARSQP